jgi:NitT/TauT family transport system permease protein
MSQQGMELTVEAPADLAAASIGRAGAGRGAATVLTARGAADARRGRWRSVTNAICVPVAAGAALVVHVALPDRGPVIRTPVYTGMLVAFLALGVVAIGVRWVSPAARGWIAARAPLFAGGLFLLCAWDLITAKLLLLPAMYFPGPQRVFQTLIDDRGQLFDSTWHSLLLLFGGYALGVLSGLVSGITMGWSGHVRY